jgi:predicted transposase YdaD
VRWEEDVPNEWDHLTKLLMQANPQDLVSWVLTDAIYEGELNVELQKYPIRADLLYTVKWKGEEVALHVEFQHDSDNKMDRRAWEYNCLTSIHTGLPVYSVVIYLVKAGSIADPPYEIKLPTGFTVHRFLFQNIKLWEIPAEVLKRQKLPGLLPLLPLTEEGERREVVEDMIECLQQAGRADLLPLAYAFSALTFKEENERQWLKERFDTMEDILAESWAYQEMVQKGMAKGLERGLKQGLEQGKQQGLEQGKQQGLEQGKQQGLEQGKLQSLEEIVVRFVEIHFPDLVPLAKQQVRLATTSQQLQEMVDKLFVAHTDREAKAVLLGQ